MDNTSVTPVITRGQDPESQLYPANDWTKYPDPCAGLASGPHKASFDAMLTDGLRHSAARHAERVTLRDGGHALIRPLLEQDRPSVVSLLAGLSPESRAQRFHSSCLPITPAVIDLVTAGHVLVATRDGSVVALASFHPERDPSLAEVAIVVADAEQRRGIGKALGQRLLRDAWSAGIRRLRAEVVGSNRGVLALLRTLGLPMTRHARGMGLITVEIEL